MGPDDGVLGWIYTAAGLFGAIAGAIGISRWQNNELYSRVSNLEKKESPSADECGRMRQTCPVLLMIESDRQKLADIKTCLDTVLREMRTEFSNHNELHLIIANDLGGIKEALRRQ